MGANSSSETIINETLDVINENLTNILITTTSNSAVNCAIVQIRPINITGTLKNCTINGDLTADIKSCNLTQVFQKDTSTDLTNLINAAIDQAATSKSSAAQGFLAMPFSSSNSSSITNIKSYLKNVISTNITNETVTTCMASSTITQNSPINISGSCIGSVLNVPVNAQSETLANCFTQTINNIIKNDTILQKAAQDVAASSSSSMGGIGDIIESLASKLGGLFGFGSSTMIYIIIAIIIFIMILMWPSSKEKAEYHANQQPLRY